MYFFVKKVYVKGGIYIFNDYINLKLMPFISVLNSNQNKHDREVLHAQKGWTNSENSLRYYSETLRGPYRFILDELYTRSIVLRTILFRK